MRRVHKLTGSKMHGLPLMYLSTVGAKSGQRRTSTVMAFTDGKDAWLIVAAGRGTSDHPAWFYNVAQHPDDVEIDLHGRRIAVTPQTLTGDQRAAAWERITSARPEISGYQEKTDRELPIVRLTAR
jgi:deazaflavin-dependent oxidoreductase (nitroreductase family)